MPAAHFEGLVIAIRGAVIDPALEDRLQSIEDAVEITDAGGRVSHTRQVNRSKATRSKHLANRIDRGQFDRVKSSHKGGLRLGPRATAGLRGLECRHHRKRRSCGPANLA